MSEWENNIGIVGIALLAIAVMLWITSFIRILKSDNINLVKLILLASIFVIPILGIVYPLLPNFLKSVKKDFESAPERIEKAAEVARKVSSGIFSWLIKK
ncbi:hypothetical protein [Methylomonas koyamae]|uniref:hypothetical protein n=1 Tax=Methylomonas koyamae TaxID=702114 RepID=UPI0028738712|nr:hypothetical protein [Methylomonas koyamae]WNB75766.1 hypothetical protein RI210_21230 [Methylomonas koyamae]